MARVKLLFYGTDQSETEQHELEVFWNNRNEIYISIEGDRIEHICLDKSTAIKFAKTLRTEINKIEEVDNV